MADSMISSVTHDVGFWMESTPVSSLTKNVSGSSEKSLKHGVELPVDCTITSENIEEISNINELKSKTKEGSRRGDNKHCEVSEGKKSGRKNKNNKRKSKKSKVNTIAQFCCKSKNCKRKFTHRANYNTHLRTHYKLKAGTCKRCGKGFASKKMLKLHKCFLAKNPQIDAPTFICKECGEMFYQRGTLQVHMQSHKSTNLYSCGLCTKVFMLKSTMYKHILSHVSNFKCQTCSRIYKLPWQLDQHVLTHYENLNHHQCVYCERIFLKQDNFERHIKFHVRQNDKKDKKFTKVINKKKTSSSKKKNGSAKQLHVKMPFKIKSKRKYTKRQPKVDNKALTSGQPLEDSPAIYYSPGTERTNNTQDAAERFDLLHPKTPFIHTFHCILCKLTFDNASMFEQHVGSHKPGDSFENQETSNLFLDGELKNIFACQYCDKKFVNRKFAESHLIYFLDNNLDGIDKVHKQFVEDIEKSADGLIDFDMYMYSFSVAHLKSIDATKAVEKTVLFHCAKCNTNFTGRAKLFSHVKNCRKDMAKFWCPECSLKFETNRLLKDHIQLGHPKVQNVLSKTDQNLVVFTTKTPTVFVKEENNFIQCKRCDLTFSTTKEYVMHKKIHSAEVPKPDGRLIKCSQCDAVLTCEAELYKHLAVHAKPIKAPSKNAEYMDKMLRFQDKWICKLCNKSYSSKCNLTRHITLHDKTEKKDHPCPFCDRIFKYHRYLQHHIMYMHKAKDEDHKCAECGANFKTMNHLKRHMTLHTGEYILKKNVSCSYCDKQFKCTEELKTHVRMHTGERPFGCEYCSYRSATYGNLNKHVQRRHETPINIDGKATKKRRYRRKADRPSHTNSSQNDGTLENECIEILHSEQDVNNSTQSENTTDL